VIAEVFRCFDDLPGVVALLQTFAKKHPDDFDELIALLTAAS
jgi:hypothetical protein